MKTKQLDSGLMVPITQKEPTSTENLLFAEEDKKVAQECLFRLYGQIANHWRCRDVEIHQKQLDAIKKLARELIDPNWVYDGEILC